MKFEEVYSTYDHHLHSVDEIYQLTKSEPQRFVLDYQFTKVGERHRQVEDSSLS